MTDNKTMKVWSFPIGWEDWFCEATNETDAIKKLIDIDPEDDIDDIDHRVAIIIAMLYLVGIEPENTKNTTEKEQVKLAIKLKKETEEKCIREYDCNDNVVLQFIDSNKEDFIKILDYANENNILKPQYIRDLQRGRERGKVEFEIKYL